MTCIVGLVHGYDVWMGADSGGVIPQSWLSVQRADPKIVRVGALLFGYTSSFRMGQLLRYQLSVPRPRLDVDAHQYMVEDVIEAIRTCFKEYGYNKADNGRDEGGAFLVAYDGRLFEIGDDYQVGENATGYAVVGSGDAAALGALAAMEMVTPELGPQGRVLSALQAAERHNIGVRGPMVMEKL